MHCSKNAWVGVDICGSGGPCYLPQVRTGHSLTLLSRSIPHPPSPEQCTTSDRPHIDPTDLTTNSHFITEKEFEIISTK